MILGWGQSNLVTGTWTGSQNLRDPFLAMALSWGVVFGKSPDLFEIAQAAAMQTLQRPVI